MSVEEPIGPMFLFRPPESIPRGSMFTTVAQIFGRFSVARPITTR